MIYLLGKYSRIIRWWWFEKTGNWQWGLVRWLSDCPDWGDYEKSRIITNQILDMHHRNLHPMMLTESRFRHFIKTLTK